MREAMRASLALLKKELELYTWALDAIDVMLRELHIAARGAEDSARQVKQWHRAQERHLHLTHSTRLYTMELRVAACNKLAGYARGVRLCHLMLCEREALQFARIKSKFMGDALSQVIDPALRTYYDQ